MKKEFQDLKKMKDELLAENKLIAEGYEKVREQIYEITDLVEQEHNLNNEQKMALDHQLESLDDEIDALRKQCEKGLDHWTRRNAKMVDREAEEYNEDNMSRLDDYERKKKYLRNQEKDLRVAEQKEDKAGKRF